METTATEQQLVNGIFRGGGARGVAYAGALKAVESSGMWFGSVAGASAGAITAALIAAGLTADELAGETSAALASVRGGLPKRLVQMVAGHRHAFYDSDALRTWLAERLGEAMGTDPGRDVTFADLYERTEIELFVVTMDLATKAPIVFQHERTPDVAVADAVVASCAIPMAFPARRAVVADDQHGGRVHQLVDGGAWANYPSFVYDDESFATWLGGDATLARERSARETLGFVLGDIPDHGDARAVDFVSSGPSRRFDRGSALTSKSAASFSLAAVLASDWARGFLAVATIVWAILSVRFWPDSMRLLEDWLSPLPDGLEPLITFFLGGMIVLAGGTVFAAALLLLATSRLLAETGLPSAQAALGVATGVAPWVGSADDDYVLTVPDNDIGTTEFGVTKEKADRAVELAAAAALDQLRGFHGLVSGLKLQIPDAVAIEHTPARPTPTQRPMWASLLFSAIVAAVVAGVGWLVLSVIVDFDTSWLRLLALILPVLAVLAAAVVFAGRMGSTAAARADRWVDPDEDHPTADRATAIVAALGVLALVGGPVLGIWRYEERDDALARAQIVAAEQLDDDNRYAIEGELLNGGVLADELRTDDELRLGEEVLLSVDDDGRWRLTRSTSEFWTAIAIAITVFGIGAVTSAVKRRSWLLRDHRLAAILRDRTRRPGTHA
ncbi:MAG: patatin-like phospholipase family protein [Actinomycetota bacterium]